MYSWDETGFNANYKSFADLSLSKEDIVTAMPEFIKVVFPTAEFCPKMKTVSIDGTIFDLNNQVRRRFHGLVCWVAVEDASGLVV